MSTAARRSENLGILLDWFTVRYATLWLVLACLVATGIGGGVWLWHRQGRDRREAQAEVNIADQRHREASRFGSSARLTALLQNAEAKLGEARGHFDRGDYTDARTSAIVSQNYSQQLIDIGRGEGTVKEEVRIYRLEGDVRVKRAGEFHWESASTNASLSLGDQVKTSATGTVQIIYFDGTMTTIKPGSLLEIKELTRLPALKQQRVTEKLNFGELEAATRKQDGEASFHEISTETTVVRSSDDAHVSVRSAQDTGESQVSLFTGTVEVQAGGRNLSLGEREQVTVHEGKMGEVEKLPAKARLIQPLDGKVFTYPDPLQARTTLVWERVPEAHHYRLQISERPLFANPLVDNGRIQSASVELTGLGAATYHWRVAAVDAQDREGPFSDVRSIRITSERLQAKADQVPPALAVADFIQNGSIIIITGKTEPGATVWADNERVEVDDRGDFRAVVRLRREGVNRVRLVAQDAEGNETARVVEAVVDS